MVLKDNPNTRHFADYFVALLVVVCSTVISLLLRPYLAAANLVMIYLTGVVIVAAKCDRRAAIFTSIVAVAAFDFFCVPPYLTFVISQYEYLITFTVMLGVALFISTMTAQLRLHAFAADTRESQTKALYQLLHDLSGQTRVFDIMRIAAQLAEKTFDAKVTVFLPDDKRQISFNKRTSDVLFVSSSEQPVTQRVFETGEPMRTTGEASALYIPVKTEREVFGVMAVRAKSSQGKLSSQEESLLDVFVRQTALATARAVAASTAQAAEVRVEAEGIRTSLLSAISHDLRTPLASITGSAETVQSHWERLDSDTRKELLTSIIEEGHRLNRLLSNLLEVTKLERGVQLHKERFPLEEIVGSALHRLRGRVQDREVRIDIPADLPTIAMDAVLMEQVFINLVENAIKYTPEASTIEIAANRRHAQLHIEIRDHGTGFAPGDGDRIFDKFFRGRTDNTRGAGLGLAICSAIVEAHGGSIRAENRIDTPGAVIRFHIPMTEARE